MGQEIRQVAALLLFFGFLFFQGCAEEQKPYLQGDIQEFRVRSSSFGPGGEIDGKHTCDGVDVSPMLIHYSVPEQALSLAVVCKDLDARVHWVTWNLDPKKNISEGTGNSVVYYKGQNDFGRLGYNGPCPPAGQRHTYECTVYALDSKLKLYDGATARDVLEAMNGKIVGKGALNFTYKR